MPVPSHTISRPAAIRTLLILLLVGLVVADIVYFTRAMDRRKPTLKRWLPYAAELGQDHQLYARHPDYLYPPFFLVLLRPLTHLPVVAAAILWQLAKYAAVGLIFAALWDLVARAGPFPLWAKVVTVVISARFIASDLRHGNVNLFIALCVVGALWLLLTKRPFLAGALIAVATCIKVTPGLYAAYLLYQRRWKALAGLAVAAVICLEVVPLAVLSPTMNHALLASWYDHVVGDFLAHGQVHSGSMNQSVVAVTNRLLGNKTAVPDEDAIGGWVLPPSAIRWVQRGIALLFLAVLAWNCRGKTTPPDVRTTLVEWSLVAPVCLALSGYTWTGHFCILIPAVTALVALLALVPLHRDHRTILILTGTAFAIFVFASGLLTEAGREWTSRVGLQLAAALLLFVALILARARLRAEAGHARSRNV